MYTCNYQILGTNIYCKMHQELQSLELDCKSSSTQTSSLIMRIPHSLLSVGVLQGMIHPGNENKK